MHNQKGQNQDGGETVCAISLGSDFNRCNFLSFCLKPLQVKCFIYLSIYLPQTKNYEQKKKYYLQKGKDRFVAVLPTGFGKSLLFQALPDFFPVKADNIIVYYFSKLVRAL